MQADPNPPAEDPHVLIPPRSRPPTPVPDPDPPAHPEGALSEADTEALYREHARTVYRYARARVDTADAQDVVAEVFAIAWRKGEPADLHHPRAWLLAIARRVLANQIRGRGRRTALADRLRLHPAPETARATALVDELDALRRALAQLRPADREVIELLAAAELSTSEIALVLGCSPAGAATRVHRARRRLRAVYPDPASEED